MALSSMTGFARSHGASGPYAFEWELKSVNAKGFDLRTRLPTGWDDIEATIRKRAAQVLSRGTVYARLHNFAAFDRPPQRPLQKSAPNPTNSVRVQARRVDCAERWAAFQSSMQHKSCRFNRGRRIPCPGQQHATVSRIHHRMRRNSGFASITR